MTIQELEVLRTEVTNYLDRGNFDALFIKLSPLTFCKGIETYKKDFVHNNIADGLNLFTQKVRLFLTDCIEHEMTRLRAIEDSQHREADRILEEKKAEIARLEATKQGLRREIEEMRAERERLSQNLQQSKTAAVFQQDEEAKKWFEVGNEMDDMEVKISAYDQAIILNPSYAEAYHMRGLGNYQLHEYQKALCDFDKAIELQLGNPSVYSDRGSAKYNLGIHQEAIDDFNRAIVRQPDNGIFFWNRAFAYAALKNKHNTLGSLHSAIRLLPLYKERLKAGRDFEFHWLRGDPNFEALLK